MAFPPDYAEKGHFYVNYTNKAGSTVVARYRLTPNRDLADVSSEQILLTVPQPYANHNGGQLAFGPNDGYLYIGMGMADRAVTLRTAVRTPRNCWASCCGSTSNQALLPYVIPATNPFAQTAGFRGEVWALGLRNPWRFAFDPANGDLYIADVGQNSYEEVDYQPAASRGGENYGWRIMEGQHCYNPANCSPTGLTLPVVEYSHAEGCSITGGAVYRGSQFVQMQGVYFYADYGNGKIWDCVAVPHPGQPVCFSTVPFTIATFGEDESGEVYVADYSGGLIYRIVDQL